MAQDLQDMYGALVGWSCQDMGDKFILKVQVMEPSEGDTSKNLRSAFLLLTKSQAAIFGNYLTEVSGHIPPTRRKSFVSRIWQGRRSHKSA